MDLFEQFDCYEKTCVTDKKENDDSNSDSDSDNNQIIKCKDTTKVTINYTPGIGSNSSNKLTIPITKSGAFINFSMLDHDLRLVKKIENYFTLKTMPVFGPIKQSKRCKVDKKNKRIIVPRFGIYELIDNPKFKLSKYTTTSQIKEGNPPSKPFKWQINFYNNNQKLVSDYIVKNVFTKQRVRCGSAGLILNLEAGQGKSYLAAYLMSIVQKKTAIILHNTALIEQWVAVLKASLGDDVSIGMYYGQKKLDGDVVIMIIDSATSDKFTFYKIVEPEESNKPTKVKVELSALEFYNQFGFIILDECHVYANNFAAKAFRNAQTPYMLGLSATPDENANGFDKIVWWDIGPVLDAKLIPKYESIDAEFKASVHRIMYYGPPDYTKVITSEAGMVSIASTINMICEDPYRNTLVVECITRCLDAKHQTFVFADRREYLEELRQILITTRKNVDTQLIETDDDYMRVVGGTTLEDLSRAERKAKVIFSTYQYLSTGKSIPRMTGLVLANPRKSKIKQFIGRIFRLGSDVNIERLIYDIVDMKLVFKNQYTSRKKYYNEKHYTIVEEKRKYSDIEVIKVPNQSKTTNLPNQSKTTNLPNQSKFTTLQAEKILKIEKRNTEQTKKAYKDAYNNILDLFAIDG